MSSSEAAMGRGGLGAQRPVLRDNEPKKTGARSARASTRGQNLQVCTYKLIKKIPCFSIWLLQYVQMSRIMSGCGVAQLGCGMA